MSAKRVRDTGATGRPSSGTGVIGAGILAQEEKESKSKATMAVRVL